MQIKKYIQSPEQEAQTELISRCLSVPPNQRKAYMLCLSGFYAEFHKELKEKELKEFSLLGFLLKLVLESLNLLSDFNDISLIPKIRTDKMRLV